MTDSQRTTFEDHWRRNRAVRVNDSKLAEAVSFLEPLWQRAALAGEGLRILDVGCGDGVHATAVRRQTAGAHHYVGVDRAFEATTSAAARSHEPASGARASYSVADALALPFRSGSFDVVFSYGVLAYTGAPQAAFDELVRVCRPGGLVGIWTAPKRTGPLGAALRLIRATCAAAGPAGSRALVNAVVPFLFVLPVRSGVNLATASWAECREVVEVNLLPAVEYYSFDQVRDWFTTRAVSVSTIDRRRPIAIWGQTSTNRTGQWLGE